MIRESRAVYSGKTMDGNTFVEAITYNDGRAPTVTVHVGHAGHETILSLGYHSAGMLGDMLRSASDAARHAPALPK